MKNLKQPLLSLSTKLLGFAFFLSLFSFCLSSCTQQAAEEQAEMESVAATAAAEEEQEEGPLRYLYFLDSKEVKEGTFDPADEKYIVDVTGEEDPKVKDGGLIKIWAFTSESAYIDWGNTHGMPVACLLELEAHLRDYAVRSGAIDHYERTGEILPEYEEYAEKYYHRMSCNRNDQGTRGLGLLFKNCPVGGGGQTIITFKPFMWPTWNNTVSRYFTFNIFNGLIAYDRSFFRRKMATIWNWGWTTYCFNGPLSFLNDRMTSAILI